MRAPASTKGLRVVAGLPLVQKWSIRTRGAADVADAHILGVGARSSPGWKDELSVVAFYEDGDALVIDRGRLCPARDVPGFVALLERRHRWEYCRAEAGPPVSACKTAR